MDHTASSMNQKLVWFFLGAAFASLFWAIAMSVLHEQLLQTFFGFGGH
jgi:hypothetical protein